MKPPVSLRKNETDGTRLRRGRQFHFFSWPKLDGFIILASFIHETTTSFIFGSNKTENIQTVSCSFKGKPRIFFLWPGFLIYFEISYTFIHREFQTLPRNVHLTVFPIYIELVNENWGFKNTNVNRPFSNCRKPLLSGWMGGWEVVKSVLRFPQIRVLQQAISADFTYGL